eukprot:TRINITY_DN11148_c0_g1_i1.p3 TRINITY_DN11148_c0_g1~~TRINITY_DN11148_c0_g1_i1.p3  ORF type:complete len:218 (-),score=-7.87 TRINITY_DN11148_c0_g1_i1:378-1031(-)
MCLLSFFNKYNVATPPKSVTTILPPPRKKNETRNYLNCTQQIVVEHKNMIQFHIRKIIINIIILKRTNLFLYIDIQYLQIHANQYKLFQYYYQQQQFQEKIVILYEITKFSQLPEFYQPNDLALTLALIKIQICIYFFLKHLFIYLIIYLFTQMELNQQIIMICNAMQPPTLVVVNPRGFSIPHQMNKQNAQDIYLKSQQNKKRKKMHLFIYLLLSG